jgi:hypothetical protein
VGIKLPLDASVCNLIPLLTVILTQAVYKFANYDLFKISIRLATIFKEILNLRSLCKQTFNSWPLCTG